MPAPSGWTPPRSAADAAPRPRSDRPHVRAPRQPRRVVARGARRRAGCRAPRCGHPPRRARHRRHAVRADPRLAPRGRAAAAARPRHPRRRPAGQPPADGLAARSRPRSRGRRLRGTVTSTLAHPVNVVATRVDGVTAKGKLTPPATAAGSSSSSSRTHPCPRASTRACGGSGCSTGRAPSTRWASASPAPATSGWATARERHRRRPRRLRRVRARGDRPHRGAGRTRDRGRPLAGHRSLAGPGACGVDAPAAQQAGRDRGGAPAVDGQRFEAVIPTHVRRVGPRQHPAPVRLLLPRRGLRVRRGRRPGSGRAQPLGRGHPPRPRGARRFPRPARVPGPGAPGCGSPRR